MSKQAIAKKSEQVQVLTEKMQGVMGQMGMNLPG